MANEKRLIDIEQAKRATYEEIFWSESEQAVVRNFLARLPKVDAVEVVHAYWTGSRFNPMTDEYEEYCSNCCAWSSEYGKPYCPNCGAKMDGGNEDA